ncbi:endochitinase A1 isoform X2 [Aplysia californica]|uniref:Endochitinase A1 isoform X2 n=1 Tax=Aplysia californica TaxID=6500 RepID=A0ABM0KAR0_APLCA|nr:endochitinase A1 isoform X2 [Aplysia californica]
MSTSVTTHSSSVHVSVMGPLTSQPAVDKSVSSAPSPTSSPLSVSGMSGLLNSRNLDEKLVVATLATLDSGSPSHLIKQDLKLIIQSRRKAEGKAELQVEFKKPVKEELTTEELKKRARRRELNRLAARRSREKGQKRKDKLVEEIRHLQSQNSELVTALGSLTDQRNRIIETLRQHMKQCSDYRATQNAAVGLSHRVLEMLGFPTPSSLSAAPLLTTPPVRVKEEVLSYPPPSPLLVGLPASVKLEDTSPLMSPSLYGGSAAPAHTGSFTTSAPNSPRATPSSLDHHHHHHHHHHPVHLPLAAKLALSARRSSTQGLETSSAFTSADSSPFVSAVSSPLLSIDTMSQSSESSAQVSAESSPMPAVLAEEDVGVVYKHKLMKHRRERSDFTKPSTPATAVSSTRPNRAFLERSFSFPSSSSETRTCTSVTTPGLDVTEIIPSDSGGLHGVSNPRILSHSPAAVLDSGTIVNASEAPLDLRRKRSNMSHDSGKNLRSLPSDMFGSSSSSTPPGRCLERRWSVDEQHTSCPPRPVNMSHGLEGEGPLTLSQSSTSSSTSESSVASKYSKLTVDSCS